MGGRRKFLAQLAASAAVLSFDPAELHAASSAESAGEWDNSWIDRVTSAQFRMVFNVSEVADGAALDYVSRIYDGFRDAHGSNESQVRPVLVFRHDGTILGINDAMWEKYTLADEQKVIDPATHETAKRNIYWKDEGATSRANKLVSLHARGAISLVCSLALSRIASRVASRTQQSTESVRNEFRANLIPGATLVPNGVFGVIRAQNAGCAYFPGA